LQNLSVGEGDRLKDGMPEPGTSFQTAHHLREAPKRYRAQLIQSSLGSLGLIPRIVLLASLFSLESVAICVWFYNKLEGDLRHWAAAPVAFAFIFAVLFASLGYLKAKGSLPQISARCLGTPVAQRWLFGHVCAMAAFGFLSQSLTRNTSPGLHTYLVGGIWLAIGILAIALAALAFAPPVLWRAAFRATGYAWCYAVFVEVISCVLGKASQLLWAPAANVTFVLVRSLLHPVIGGVTADAVTHNIGTQRFMVHITAHCSGLEGAGLMVVVGGVWLWVFRREFRFPQAFALIPVGVAALYLLNVVRIAALILIGNAGAPEVAVMGFHTHAGWIAFTTVAVALSLSARRIRWFTVKAKARAVPEATAGDPNSAYLLPLLAILITAMISGAATGQFEWLYPLRFVVAAAVLWHYRSEYTRLSRNFGWASLWLGGTAFLIWLALDLALGKQTNNAEIGLALASASPSARVSWIAIRILAAVVTVPIAEELAFRGFLMRRMVSPAFLSVKRQSVTLLPILISSVAFGLLHGDRWLAGTIVGLLYALAFLRHGKMGDAVAAHATTNAMLAGYVILWGKWGMW
jgi:exosortase E/protease (VPEID-CTERM system)